ncbi:MAG: hypothetical protein WAQ52_16150 [Terriglobales bacterium]
MKLGSNLLLSAVIVATLAAFLNAPKPALAQTAIPSAELNGESPDSCPHLFSVGNGNTYLQYCVSDNGNISSIQTPFGHFHSGAQGEGYGLCQESPAVEYHDYGVSDSGNWQPPQIVSLTKSLIKISRTTSDGRWTLVQTISKVAANASIKVVMALTNNARSDQVAYLLRFADLNPNGLQDRYAFVGASFESAWAWDGLPGTTHYGLQLQTTAKSPFGYQQGFVREIPSGPNACDFAGDSSPNGLDGGSDYSIAYVYVGTVPSLQTLTVTLSYHAL